MTMFNEQAFRTKAEAEIIRCRAGDWQHALRVVEWVKQLGAGRADLLLIIAATYLHDIGWRDVLPKKKLTFEEVLLFEEQASEAPHPKGFPFGKIRLRRSGASERTIENRPA